MTSHETNELAAVAHPARTEQAAAHVLPTLVVDLDGTLTLTDTLGESVLRLVKQNPLHLFRLLFWLLSGRAHLKEQVARRHALDVSQLPWRQDLLDYVAAERARGRQTMLATAAHQDIAQAAAAHLGLFDTVLSTSGGVNLKGSHKLAAIRAAVGPHFVYAGDSAADLPLWNGGVGAVLAGVPALLAQRVTVPIEREFSNPPRGVDVWLRALRVHQWLKNTLLFVPLFTAFAFSDLAKLSAALVAFLAFSLAASATYIGNDLWDLDADRMHPRKRQRPFASATLPLGQGLAMAGALMLLAFGLAWWVGAPFTVMLVGYVMITTAYSWTLKTYVLLDVLTLATLYTWRVLAGSVAVAITVTPWLLAFAIFTFFSLALVKRCAELVSLQAAGHQQARGRDYQVHDLVVLWPMGVGASLCSVVVFGLYVGSPGAGDQYARAELLWLVGLGLLYWVARMWVKTARGEMHDDPIVFALRDRGSRWAVLSMLVVTVVAHLAV